MKQPLIPILGAIALASSLGACAVDDVMTEADEDALIREGEAEYTRITARNVDKDASLEAAAEDPLQVPLVVEIYDDPGFTGRRRNIVVDEPLFHESDDCQRSIAFDNATSSVIVREGPDYASFKSKHGEPLVVLYEHPNFKGRRIILRVGGYSDLIAHSFENVTSSAKFAVGVPDVRVPDVATVTPMRPLTAVIEANIWPFEERCRRWNVVLTMVRTSGNIRRDFGYPFSNNLSHIEIIPTTQFDPNGVLTVFDGDEFEGHHDAWNFSERYIDPADVGLDNKISSFRRSF